MVQICTKNSSLVLYVSFDQIWGSRFEIKELLQVNVHKMLSLASHSVTLCASNGLLLADHI